MSSGNRILFIVNSLQSGGAEKQMLWLAETMNRLGWRIVIYEMVGPQREDRMRCLVEKAQLCGIKFQRAPQHAKTGYVHALPRIFNILRSESFDVIWTWGLRADLLVYVLTLLRIKRGRWVSSLRNANSRAIYSARWLYWCINRHVHSFVSNTQENIRLLAEICPDSFARGRYMPNVLEELDYVRPLLLPQKRPAILTLGMLGNIDIIRKGYDTAIEVARKLKELNLPVRIVISGRPDEAAHLEGEISRNALAEYIRYEGETKKPIEFLSCCEGFLMLSRYEGMPNALMEAMSLGLPSIVTKVGDLEQMGVMPPAFELVDVDSPDQVVKRIEHMLSDWSATLEMGRRGRIWCESRFSRLHCEAQLAKLLSEFGSGK